MSNYEDSKDLRTWYVQQQPLYESFAYRVRETIVSLLGREKIAYLSVTARTKSPESLIRKVSRKTYKDPKQEITDLAGVRIITYVEPEVIAACEVIQRSFNVHPEKSLDKSSQLEVDRFGY